MTPPQCERCRGTKAIYSPDGLTAIDCPRCAEPPRRLTPTEVRADPDVARVLAAVDGELLSYSVLPTEKKP